MKENVIDISHRGRRWSSICADVFRVPPSQDFLDRLEAVLYQSPPATQRTLAEVLVVDFGENREICSE